MELKRIFLKELAGDLRQEKSDKLKEIRNEPSDISSLKNLPEKYKGDEKIEENFEKLKKDIFGKIFKTEKYRERESFINQFLIEQKRYNLEKIHEEYNKKFDEILKSCPLTQEEKEKYLSTESMENMSLDDYLTFLKRLSGEAFYYVTRYGVRENTFNSTGGGHSVGKDSFTDSISPLLKDGSIKSSISTLINNPEKFEYLINENKVQELKEKGLSIDEIVNEIMKEYKSESFLDTESTHFSYGKDLHHMYGSENDYKFYFYFPVEYILQNEFFHKTRESQLTLGGGYHQNKFGIDQQYNDFEIFNFGNGVPVNAGILCITGDIEVDPQTGSQYLLENGKPIVDENGEFKKPDNTISSKKYWENYFKLHPDLKPKKIIYENFSTYSMKENEDLKSWAKGKEVYFQDDNKIKEFEEYEKSNKEILREILKDIVKGKL